MTPELQELYDKLTDKRKRFVDLWTGDATETAKLVPFASPNVQGPRLLDNVGICRLIKAKRDAEVKPNVMSRIERQEFWSNVARGNEKQDAVIGKGEDAVIAKVPPAMKDRLKAAELLAKSEGDFIERREISGPGGKPVHLRSITEQEAANYYQEIISD